MYVFIVRANMREREGEEETEWGGKNNPSHRDEGKKHAREHTLTFVWVPKLSCYLRSMTSISNALRTLLAEKARAREQARKSKLVRE